MKKAIVGSLMFLAGLVSTALLLAGSMANDGTINGEYSAFWNLTQYGLMPAFNIFICVAIIGLAIAIWGMVEKKQ